MPTQIVIEITPTEQGRLLAQLRRARRGHGLALHILLLLALQRSPSEIAAVLLCARSTVYAVAQDWQQGRRWPEPVHLSGPPCLTPSLRRSLLALLGKSPAAYGWCRTRWSCAVLALQLRVQRGIDLSAETVRRCLHALDWVWKRAKLAAKDSDPERTAKLACVRYFFEHLGPRQALLFADELALHLLPKVGAQWMPRATQVEVMTPGRNEQRHLAGALDLRTGRVHHRLWFRKVNGLFLDLLNLLDSVYPTRGWDRIYVVADNDKIHKAKLVQRWPGQQPTRERERRMRRFKSGQHAQRFVEVHGIIASHFRPRRHLLSAADYRRLRSKRFRIWNEGTGRHCPRVTGWRVSTVVIPPNRPRRHPLLCQGDSASVGHLAVPHSAHRPLQS